MCPAGTAGGDRARRSPTLLCFCLVLWAALPEPQPGLQQCSLRHGAAAGSGPRDSEICSVLAGINCTGRCEDRQVQAVVSGLLALSLALPGAEGRAAAAVGLDTCCPHGLSRVQQGMVRPFLPRRRAPGKAGDFPNRFVARGFSLLVAGASGSEHGDSEGLGGWVWSRALPARVGGYHGRQRDMGQGRVQEGVAGLGHSGGFAMVMSGKGHSRHWASASPFLWLPWGQAGTYPSVSPLSAHGVRSPSSPRAGHRHHRWGQHGTCMAGATGSVPGLRGREGSQPVGAVVTLVCGCHSHPGLGGSPACVCFPTGLLVTPLSRAPQGGPPGHTQRCRCLCARSAESLSPRSIGASPSLE